MVRHKKCCIFFVLLLLLASQLAFLQFVPTVNANPTPSTVATSTTGYTVSYANSRKGFGANTRSWAYYSDGTNLVYKSTTDPTDWSAGATTIRACTTGYHFAIWFDGAYVHYVAFYSNDLFYGRGTPNSNGTTTWSAAEQLVYDGTATENYDSPTITVDSSGYAWIGVTCLHLSGYWYPYALKNANNDGTWSTDFSTQLSTTSRSTWKVSVVSLTSQKVYVIYAYDNSASRGILYDGGWGSEESDLTDYNVNAAYQHCAIANGDDVHFVYNRRTTYQIRYNMRTYGVGWGANDVLVQDSMSNYISPALSINTATGDLCCFWTTLPTAKHVFYKNCTGGTWDVNPTDWIDESTDGIDYAFRLSSWYRDYDGKIGLLYVTKTSSPYHIKFAYLVMPQVSITAQLNLRVMDWDLTDAISNAQVTMNNGTNNVKTSSSGGWANYTSVTGTVTVSVTYYGKNVNGTSITVSADTTKNLKCKLYDVTITAKPNNEIGILSGVNVTAYNDTGTASGKIKSGITVDYTGQTTLTNLPNATLRFILRVKSDYTIIIANVTKTISSDGQTESIAGTQNYVTVNVTPILFVGFISSWCFNHKKAQKKAKSGGDSKV